MALLGNLTGSAQYFNDDDFYSGTVTQSLRLDSGSSNHLYWTPSASSTSTRTFTVSTWVKLGNLKTGSDSFIWCGQNVSDTTNCDLNYKTNSGEYYFQIGANGQSVKNTSQLSRDVSAWYHLVAVFDMTQGTDTNRIKLYVNGEQSTISGTFPSQNTDFDIGGSNKQMIGALNLGSAGRFFDGYIGEFNFVDGQALTPTSFGETKNGVWIPKTYRGAYGTNGFRLQFNQVGVGTASTSTIGADTSGNTNHWTSSGIVASDCAMPDSPENNFCTWNPLIKAYNTVVFKEGNLWADSTTANWSGVFSTHSMNASKWYWEVSEFQNTNVWVGIVVDDTDVDVSLIQSATGAIAYKASGDIRTDNTTSSGWGASYSTTDIIGVALDLDSGTNTVKFYKNNALQGTINLTSNFTGKGVLAFVASNACDFTANFGQDSSFAGTKTAQGNTDGNGIGDFYYAPPSGYLALCTANLPEPTIGANSLTQADDYFNTVLYSGDSSTGNAITGVGFQPDWLWIKHRSGTSNHVLQDSSRGIDGGEYLQMYSDATSAETTQGDGDGVLSLGSDGFTVSYNNSGAWNQSGQTYVSWNWKANGGTTSSNSDGSITSTVQANTNAGFSIVTYTGTGANATVGHGLGVVPQMFIVKNRDSAESWLVYHHKNTSAPETDALQLNLASATVDSAGAWNDTAPTSSVFSVGSGNASNQSSDTFIAYCFHSVEGYSKFGSHIGNGNADGTFVYTGFRPAFVMIKCTDTAGTTWWMEDSARDTFNPQSKILVANTSAAEASLAAIDTLSNGFKFRHTSADVNGSGKNYIYMAFAEAPFKYANAR